MGARYGKGSAEYKKAGCVRKSERKQRSVASPKQGAGVAEAVEQTRENLRDKRLVYPAQGRQRRYVEVSQWSPLLEIPERNLVITPEQGEQMSILVKQLQVVAAVLWQDRASSWLSLNSVASFKCI